MNLEKILSEQKEICKKYNTNHFESNSDDKMGISETVKEKKLPINGMRIKPENGTCGWYIWAGEEFSNEDDFFKPVHVEHAEEWFKGISKYLGLPPGWRFLVTDEYEDVWFDENLLKED